MTATISSAQPRLRQHSSDEPRALSDGGAGARTPVGDLKGGYGPANTYRDSREGGPPAVRRECLRRTREVQREQSRARLQGQVRRSTLDRISSRAIPP